MSRRCVCVHSLATCAVVMLSGCGVQPKPGHVLDEAARAGVTPLRLHAATEDYFHDMDFNLVDGRRPVFTQDEIDGRNMWMVWTGGNDRLWDVLTVSSFGTFDLLKTMSSHPRIPYQDPHAKPGDPPKYLYGYGRHNRFYYLGVV